LNKKIDISHWNVKQRINAGISHVPEDRHKHGLDLEANVRLNTVENIITKKQKITINENIEKYIFCQSYNFTTGGFLTEYKIAEYANKIIDKYDVRGSANGTALAKSLSGGNQQKVIIGREMEKNHKLIVLVQPTRGLDIGAIQFIHSQIIKEKERGNAILLISYELDEILALADTIAVISRNKIIDSGDRKKMTRQNIGNLLAGERM
ncbi:MAG: hypothetical protein K2G48_02140, partial [Malacoplasma sp.]|nr:hypothetical protein [Malacoplasma sp.]